MNEEIHASDLREMLEKIVSLPGRALEHGLLLTSPQGLRHVAVRATDIWAGKDVTVSL
jgi:hypothetical protein